MAYIGQKPADKPLGASDITDGIISNSKLAQDIISAETELATAPADTDELLISDAGTLKRIDASLVGSADVVKLNETAHSGDVSSVSIDGHHTSDYDIYDYIIDDFSVSATSNAIRVKVNFGGTTNSDAHYRNAGYDSYSTSSGGTIGSNRDWDSTYFRPNGNWASPNATNHDNGYLHIRLVNPLSTNSYPYGFYWNSYGHYDTNTQVGHSGSWNFRSYEGTACSGMTFYLSSGGNFKSYRIRVYGIK